MFCTTSENDGEVVHVKLVQAPKLCITDRSKAVILLWFYVACFGFRVSVMFHLTCVQIILVSFRLLSGHLFGNSCSYFFLYFDYLLHKLFPVLVLRAGLGSDSFSSWSLHTSYFQPTLHTTDYFKQTKNYNISS